MQRAVHDLFCAPGNPSIFYFNFQSLQNLKGFGVAFSQFSCPSHQVSMGSFVVSIFFYMLFNFYTSCRNDFSVFCGDYEFAGFLSALF